MCTLELLNKKPVSGSPQAFAMEIEDKTMQKRRKSPTTYIKHIEIQSLIS